MADEASKTLHDDVPTAEVLVNPELFAMRFSRLLLLWMKLSMIQMALTNWMMLFKPDSVLYKLQIGTCYSSFKFLGNLDVKFA